MSATVSLIFVPRGRLAPAGGDCRSTVPVGRLDDGTMVIISSRPACRRIWSAEFSWRPTRSGTVTLPLAAADALNGTSVGWQFGDADLPGAVPAGPPTGLVPCTAAGAPGVAGRERVAATAP